ncbi:hypothetical protein Droror1_Dr00010042 [Drosera rotundifolia]
MTMLRLLSPAKHSRHSLRAAAVAASHFPSSSCSDFISLDQFRGFCGQSGEGFGFGSGSEFRGLIDGRFFRSLTSGKITGTGGDLWRLAAGLRYDLAYHDSRCARFCTLPGCSSVSLENEADGDGSVSDGLDLQEVCVTDEVKPVGLSQKFVDFTEVDKDLLPTILILGRPNVGKSALFNRLIRRREALVYNTPDDHVTRDIREGIAKLGDLRFRVLDSAGLEAEASSGSILERTSEMTANVLSSSQFALFLIDTRDGLQPMDFLVGKWLRRHASGINTILVMNKSESLDDADGSLAAATGEAYNLGFGDPVPISAETGFGMADLYGALRPLLEDYMIRTLADVDQVLKGMDSSESEEFKLPLQLALVGRPNVGKSTLLNTLLQEDRVLVGPEAGLTRDSIRVQFQYEGRTIYMVDTAGWLERTKQEKGPASLSVMQTRKNLMRAHVIALILDGEEIASAQRSMKHAEMVIARQAVEEGRGLVIIVNKMDLLKGRKNTKLYGNVTKIVPEEIKKLIPQLSGIPILFVSALEKKGQRAIMRQVIETYEKWCSRLPTARLNRWLRKVMSRHSWKDQASQPKIKYFTQVKARPPTFVAFVKGKAELSDTDIRFLTRSLKEDFSLAGIPIRILQRSLSRHDENSKNSSSIRKSRHVPKLAEGSPSDKRQVATTVD